MAQHHAASADRLHQLLPHACHLFSSCCNDVKWKANGLQGMVQSEACKQLKQGPSSLRSPLVLLSPLSPLLSSQITWLLTHPT